MDPPRPRDPKIAGLADRTTALVGWTIAWRATRAIATLALGALLIRQLPPAEDCRSAGARHRLVAGWHCRGGPVVRAGGDLRDAQPGDRHPDRRGAHARTRCRVAAPGSRSRRRAGGRCRGTALPGGFLSIYSF